MKRLSVICCKSKICRVQIAILLTILILPLLLVSAHAQAPTSGVVNSQANIRSGPATTYAIVGNLPAGSAVEIVGCNTDCTWYEIGPNTWIAAFLVTVNAAAQPASQPAATSGAAPITIVAWNVESGGALQNVVAGRLGSFQDVDIWGLSEVNAVDAEAFEFGAEEGEGANYESYLGTTGAADRLLLIWDEDRFDLVGSGQLTDMAQNARAPLWAQLRDSATGLEFIAMVNHLHRSNEGTRHRQAQMLNAWAAGQTLPIVAIGDYNFDWNLPNGDTDHDLGYDNLTRDGVWAWVRPAELVTTQCSGWPCGFNSVLDFVFVAGPAREWAITSQIVVAENDFPDDLTTPDHRPVLAVIHSTTGGAAAPVATTAPAATATSAPAACPQPNSNANLRAGPGTGYAVAGSVARGQCLTITGRTDTGEWLQLSNGAWIAAFLIANPPAMAAIPVVIVATPTAAPVAPTAAPTQAPAVPPTATPVPAQPSAQNCDPSYPGVCIPPYPPDLDCGQISFRRFQVVGADPHGFDGDADGIGCEG